MTISSIQQGLIVQQEFAKLLMMGSNGRVELAAPVSDDERRDYEVHVHGQYGFDLAIQVKSSTRLHRLAVNPRYLMILFDVQGDRLVNSPFFWYFFAYLDPKLMRFGEPTFLIPSKDFHENAAPRRRGAFWKFTLAASMEPKTRDKWHPYRVGTHELGARLLEIMNGLKNAPRLSSQASNPPAA